MSSVNKESFHSVIADAVLQAWCLFRMIQRRKALEKSDFFDLDEFRVLGLMTGNTRFAVVHSDRERT